MCNNGVGFILTKNRKKNLEQSWLRGRPLLVVTNDYDVIVSFMLYYKSSNTFKRQYNKILQYFLNLW